jgi:YbbR domain-containing protein
MDKWLRNSNVVKIIALVLGLLLWVVVRMDNSTAPGSVNAALPEKKIYGVSITSVYDHTKYNIVSVEPGEVQVTLRGRESALKRLQADSYQVVLDLTNYSAGTHNLALRPEGFPNGVEVEIYPPTVKVALEDMSAKVVPVEVMIAGSPAEGYQAGAPIISPNRVHVTVPASRIGEIESVKGEISIDGANANVVKQIKLAAFNKNGRELDGVVTPAVVDVEVPITIPFKTMPLQIKMVGQSPDGYAVSSYTKSVDQVTVYGPQHVLDSLEFYDVLQVDLSGINKDAAFSLDIPLKPNITKVEPAKVDIQMSIVPSTVRKLEHAPLTIIGANTEYDTKLIQPENGTLDITVEGAPGMIQGLTLQDIQAIVDVSQLQVGQHSVPVKLNLPPFVKRSGAEMTVTVEIAIKEKKVAAERPAP